MALKFLGAPLVGQCFSSKLKLTLFSILLSKNSVSHFFQNFVFSTIFLWATVISNSKITIKVKKIDEKDYKSMKKSIKKILKIHGNRWPSVELETEMD